MTLDYKLLYNDYMTTNKVYEQIAKQIRESRMAQDISQEELAAKSKVDRTYLARIEEQKANPSVKVLVKLARALGLKLVITFTK